MQSVDPLPQEVIRLRIAQVKAGSPKAYEATRPCNQRFLRLSDIAAYIGAPKEHMYLSTSPVRYQKELSWFFRLWDAGALVKEKGGDGKWSIVRRHSRLEEVAPAASSPGQTRRRIDMQIDLTAAGPRLKLT